MRLSRCVGISLLAFAIAGCSSLPTNGPRASKVLSEQDGERSGEARYSVVEVDENVIRVLRERAGDLTLSSFGGHRGGAVDTRVGVGDAVALTIWEAGAGGLFSSAPVGLGGAVAGGTRAAGIPDQIVGRDGFIMVPYAGRVRAAGRSTTEIQRQIERALEGKAIQPQVLVTVTRPLSNTVTVIGEAVAGARIPVSPRGDRVLDIIAQAGGSRSPTSETFVQVTRGGRSARVSMQRIASDSRENIYVRPGDVITVTRDPQYFMAYGATGRSADISFDGVDMTLAKALSKAGGLIDSRADPEGVFVFRFETPEIARALGADAPNARQGGRVKVVYRINMRDPNGLFLAQQMRIFNRDLVYVSNALLSDVQKFMMLFNLMTSPVAQGASVGYTLSRINP
jgi:polysaccharide export outer membrane protein